MSSASASVSTPSHTKHRRTDDSDEEEEEDVDPTPKKRARGDDTNKSKKKRRSKAKAKAKAKKPSKRAQEAQLDLLVDEAETSTQDKHASLIQVLYESTLLAKDILPIASAYCIDEHANLVLLARAMPNRQCDPLWRLYWLDVAFTHMCVELWKRVYNRPTRNLDKYEQWDELIQCSNAALISKPASFTSTFKRYLEPHFNMVTFLFEHALNIRCRPACTVQQRERCEAVMRLEDALLAVEPQSKGAERLLAKITSRIDALDRLEARHITEEQHDSFTEESIRAMCPSPDVEVWAGDFSPHLLFTEWKELRAWWYPLQEMMYEEESP